MKTIVFCLAVLAVACGGEDAAPNVVEADELRSIVKIKHADWSDSNIAEYVEVIRDTCLSDDEDFERTLAVIQAESDAGAIEDVRLGCAERVDSTLSD